MAGPERKRTYSDSGMDTTSLVERPIKKNERSHEENQERAYIAASRRSDRSLEARIQSAMQASEIHKKRTGKGLKITPEIVEREEMYEEEEDVPRPLRFYNSASASTRESLASIEQRESAVNQDFAKVFGQTFWAANPPARAIPSHFTGTSPQYQPPATPLCVPIPTAPVHFRGPGSPISYEFTSSSLPYSHTTPFPQNSAFNLHEPRRTNSVHAASFQQAGPFNPPESRRTNSIALPVEHPGPQFSQAVQNQPYFAVRQQSDDGSTPELTPGSTGIETPGSAIATPPQDGMTRYRSPHGDAAHRSHIPVDPSLTGPRSHPSSNFSGYSPLMFDGDMPESGAEQLEGIECVYYMGMPLSDSLGKAPSSPADVYVSIPPMAADQTKPTGPVLDPSLFNVDALPDGNGEEWLDQWINMDGSAPAPEHPNT
ncbi:hypothetical protein QBC47DRAFT_378743 [Echria macrotheca]|uniref:Uncharacterized protein n=1 Tax=Echria macrotheca TaxID=438768 RepID=A0AAJ0BFD5_9PEZI|nr:hypothetical protein QBC47DRAFT_378743 [Echria macrotheca]